MTAFGEIATAVEAMRRGAWHTSRSRSARSLSTRETRTRRRGGAAATQTVGTSTAFQRSSRPPCGSRARMSRCSCSARAAPARSWSRARSTLAARARRAPFVAINCAAMPDDAARERAVRSRARRVHRRDAPTRAGLFERGRRRHAVPRRDRRHAARAAGEAAARARRSARSDRVGGDATQRTSTCASSPRRNRDLDAARSRDGTVPRGPLLPARRRRRSRCRRCASAATTSRCSPQHFLARHGGTRLAAARRFAADALARCAATRWPGNVRELENVVERLAILGTASELDAGDLRRLAPHLTGSPPAFETARDELCRCARSRMSTSPGSCSGATRIARARRRSSASIHRRSTGARSRHALARTSRDALGVMRPARPVLQSARPRAPTRAQPRETPRVDAGAPAARGRSGGIHVEASRMGRRADEAVPAPADRTRAGRRG